MVGTLYYMSPEQLLGMPTDKRSDLFAFDVTIYEMATASRPFSADTDAGLVDAILNKVPVPAARMNVHLPLELDHIIAKAMEKEPDLRYQSAAEIKADLKRAKRGSEDSSRGSMATVQVMPPGKPTRRRLAWYGGSLAIIILLLLGFLILSKWKGKDLAAAQPLPQDHHVSILPDRENSLSGDDEILSKGMAVYLIHRMSALQRHDSRLTRALESDPSYALAHFGLGRASWKKYLYTKDEVHFLDNKTPYKDMKFDVESVRNATCKVKSKTPPGDYEYEIHLPGVMEALTPAGGTPKISVK
ncbi:serine/threonine protein kinase [Acidobacteriota bacterium]